MASRDLTNFRTVINQVADTSNIEAPDAPKQPNAMLSVGIDVATEILKQGQEAKITEGLSEAQLKLNALQNQYQMDYESDPMGGLADYKLKRQEIFDEYGGQISPLFSRQWNDSVRKVSTRNDAVQQAWALKQTRVNTLNSLNKSIKNGLMQASADGMTFGKDETAEIGAFINMANVREQLESFGNKNLGTETTSQALDTFDEDYMKVFLSGVSETNPVKALRLMETDMVKDHFQDPQQYMKMKDAVETRALNLDKINEQKEILDVMKDENNLLAKSAEKPITYAELQQEFSKGNYSQSAQNFFMKLNGYSKGKDALSTSEKVQFKADLYDMLIDAGDAEDITSEDLSKYQAKIYEGMDRGALTQKEGVDYLNGLMTPVIANKEASLAQFESGKWNPFQDNIGFSQLQPVLDQVQIAAPDGGDVGDLGQTINNENKVKLYDYYRQALGAEAAARGIAIGDIPNLQTTEKRAIYTKAQDQAKRDFWVDRYPELGSMEKIPASIITSSGKKINTGLGDGSPVASVSAGNTKIATDAKGNRALVEVDKNGGIVRVIKELPKE